MIRNLFGGATKCRTIDKLDIFGDGSCKALYRLDGNANDESGNYHGTETAITYGGGVYERGAVFNGTSSYINTGYTFPYTAFSYSLWYKYGSVNKMIISSISTNPVKAGQFSLTQDSATQLDLEFVNNDSGTQTTLLNQTVPNMNDGLFHHIVIAIESGGFMKFYFDGALINTSSAVPAFVNSNTTALNLMREPRNNYYKDGSLDQVRIFNRAITAQEVATLYAECEPTSIVDNINPFEDGSLKALYKFDGDATDATGVYNGVATNVTYASGKFGNCMVGTVSNYIDTLSNFSFMTGTNAFSWSVWIKRNDSATTEQNIFTQLQTVGGAYSHGLELYNNTIRVLFNNSSTYTISAPTDTTIWHHIAVSKIGSIMSIYLDGKPTQFTSVVSLTLYSPTWMIGRGNSSYGFNGSIDQLRIFNKALTPLEVASLYNETTPMEEPMSVQVDPFKDGSGKALYRLESNALDESGNYNGTPTSVTYGSGRFGRCAVFNGSTSQITSSYSSSSNSVQSFSFWFKANTSSFSNLLGCSDNSTYGGIIVQWYPNKLQILTSNSSGNAWNSLVTTSTLAINTWHHAVVVSIGSAISVYINGALDGNISSLSASASIRSMWVGYGGGGACFNGSIDQVRIFNRALSQSEVTTLYNEI